MGFCKYCGSQINEKVCFCPNCGAQLRQQCTGNGKLTIKFDGQWMLFDAKINIRVNESQRGSFSFKKGFEVTVPINSNRLLVDVKCTIRSYQPVLNVNPSEDYTLYLTYSRFIGNFDFILVDKSGKRIQ